MDALIPVNPNKWPAFVAGGAAASDMPDLSGRVGTPFANLQVAKEYLETSKSDRDRFWQTIEDTTIMNSMCETGGDVSIFAAGTISNKVADRYMDEMVETKCTPTSTEKLNLRIFQTISEEKKMNPDDVRGTEITREFVPKYMKGNICDRPLDWDNNSGLEEDGLGSSPSKPEGSSHDRSWSGTTSEYGRPECDTKISLDGTMSNDDEEGEGIFARCFG